MKRSFRLLTLSLVTFVLIILVSSCGGGNVPATTVSPETDPATVPVTEPKTDPVTDPATQPSTEAEKVTVMWVLQSGVFKTEAEVGSMPTPPNGYENDILSESTVYSFKGWKTTIVPVEAGKKITYYADYNTSPRFYDITLTLDGGAVSTVSVAYGEMPVDTTTEPHVFWDPEPVPVKGTASYVGTTIDRPNGDGELFDWAMHAPYTAYDAKLRYDDNQDRPMTSSSALLYLLREVETNPNAHPMVMERILYHLDNFLKGGEEPRFTNCCNWSYATVSAAINAVKRVPSVWNSLTPDQKERCDTMMACFAIITTFGTDDDNSYQTGPDFIGNYNKNWNPNYILANVEPILFAVSYFGSADAVNSILLNFDHASYINKFEKYGWTRALDCWSTPAATYVLETETVEAPSAAEAMTNGGYVYYAVTLERNNQHQGGYAGRGVGVKTTYTYKGHGLDDITGIVNSLISNNYGGGKVVSSLSDTQGVKQAYILDGTESPVQGRNGMMSEFGSGDASGIRSSASYCMHDFIMLTVAFEALDKAGLYDLENNPDYFSLVYIGNTDLVYKVEHGYHSYSLGSGYDSHETYSNGYMYAKWVWTNDLAPKYKIEVVDYDHVYSLTSLEQTITVLSPQGASLKYDNRTEFYVSSVRATQFDSDMYVIVEMDFLTGPTAKNGSFYLRAGNNNIKNSYLSYKDSTFIIDSTTSLTVPDGWHRITTFLWQTHVVSGGAVSYTISGTTYIDGVLLGTSSFTPEGSNLLYSVDPSTGALKLAPVASCIYFFHANDGKDGYTRIENLSVGYGKDVPGSNRCPSAPVTYNLNGGTFVSDEDLVREAIDRGNGTIYDAFTHKLVNVWYFYVTGTVSEDKITKSVTFKAPSAEQVTREGYTFDGWYLDEALETPYTSNALTGAPVTLFAKWVPAQ